MDLNFFTLCSALILLLPIGLMLSAAADQSLGRLLRHALVAGCTAAFAFSLFGSAVLQGDPDRLLACDSSRTLFRNFDGAAFHHAMLAIFAAGVLAATLPPTPSLSTWRGSLALSIAIAVLAGALFPSAAKLVWYGPLRRAGLIDIGGATALLALTAAFATTLLKLTTEPSRHEVVRNRSVLPGIGGLLTIVGWCALLYTTGVMQSPATCAQGAMNALRAAASAGIVAVLVVRAFGQDNGASRVLAAITMAVAATTALAGRAPAASAIMVGAVAGAIGPALVLFARRVIGRGPAGDTAAALWIGSFAACLLPVPYAGDPDGMGTQLLIQASAFAMCSGVGICAGILLSPLLRLVGARTRDEAQPTDAS